MGDDEFERAAQDTADRLRGAPLADRIAVACRGSANPAALAWIAEGLPIDAGSVVVDLGAGLGGPAAWLAARYGCRVTALEPAPSATRAADRWFDVPAVVGDAARAPFRDRCAGAALLFGVVSVVDDPSAVLDQARRLAASLGVIDYCATGSTAVGAGGSTFPTPGELVERVRAANWSITAETAVDLPSPPTWRQAIERLAPPSTSPDEDAVREAIESGALAPRMLLAR